MTVPATIKLEKYVTTVTCISESCIKIKIFIFTLLCSASKGFEGLLDLHKPFEAP